MKQFWKKTLATAAVAVCAGLIPALAVFNEKDLGKTLSVLRFELKQENEKMESARQMMRSRNDRQHGRMIGMLKKSNELSLILYSQKPDFTFDMTYALKEVTREYEDFNQRKMPFDDIVARLDMEIDRYEHLVEALRRIPPILDEIPEVPDSISISRDSLLMSFVPRKEHGHHDHDAHEGHNHGSIEEMERVLGEPDQVGKRTDNESRRPFALDEQGQADRDSCLLYARNLLKMYTAVRTKVVIDNEHYVETSERLKETYDYAQNRYREVQRRIFFTGQDNYFTVLGSIGRYSRQAMNEAREKYGSSRDDSRPDFENSDWRGPVVVGFIFFVLLYIILATIVSNLLVTIALKKVRFIQNDEFRKKRGCLTLLCGVVVFAITIMIANRFSSQNFFILASSLLLVFAWLVTAVLLSLLIRFSGDQIRKGADIYLPVIIMGLIVITFRILFIPNRLLNLIYPPLLLVFFFWQTHLCRSRRQYVQKTDMYYAWITVGVTLAATIVAWMGYVLMSVQMFIWWVFQLAAIQSITAIYDLLSRYEAKVISKKIAGKKEENRITDTWFFDFVKTAAVPVIAICTIPLCIFLAGDVFDLTSFFKTVFFRPFFNLTSASGQEILHLSIFKIVLVSALYFVFRYTSYVSKAFYKHVRFSSLANASGADLVHPNQVNLTLANNIMGIAIWGTYIIIAVLLLKIPMGALSVIAAGLATGIGLALKDVLNNFIYGIQLMSGRLKVGDYVECDGIRGKVESISYQSTQIITLEGAVMSITNTSLFNKNFKNLTRNSAYECVKIPVSVHYGADVDSVRKMLLESLAALQGIDRYGRNIVDPSTGVSVAFDGFGDSSVDLVVKQYVLVEEEIAYIAKAKEIIYNTLNDNNVEIPFPQRDVYIRQIAK